MKPAVAAAMAGLILGSAGAPAAARQHPPVPSVDAAVAAAAAYVERYQNDLQSVVADEHAVQTVTGADGLRAARRETTAEYFLTYLDRDGVWIGVRDVRAVDGAPVRDPDDVRSLLTRAPLARLAGQIMARNARYNIGGIDRNFNEPTVALLVLNRLNRRRFRFDKAKPFADGAAVTVAFREHDEPTLVRGTNGARVLSRGRFRIDAATGRIEQSTFELTLGDVHASLTTTYAADEKMQMWVPVRMVEQYVHGGSLPQTVDVESAYSNYRRFDTSVIIK